MKAYLKENYQSQKQNKFKSVEEKEDSDHLFSFIIFINLKGMIEWWSFLFPYLFLNYYHLFYTMDLAMPVLGSEQSLQHSRQE